MEPAVTARQAGWTILTNPSCAPADATNDWFEPAYWRQRQGLVGQASGRGQVYFVDTESERWVVRHYQRGGLIGRFIRDRYLYTGHERVRAVREFGLLRQLVSWELPTSEPVAARYRRHGLYYSADLITRFVPHEQTLAQFLASPNVDLEQMAACFARVGHTVSRFMARGVSHADLNCHNVLLGPDQVHIIDLDRGAIATPGSWQEQSVERLKRSALKVSPGQHHASIESLWPNLRDAALSA